MAFNDLGKVFTLAPGMPTRWGYNYQFADAGAQFAAPDVKSRGGRLVASNQTKHLMPNGAVTYTVDVMNPPGGPAIAHNIQGGGFSPGFNNSGDVVTLVPGVQAKYFFHFGGPLELKQDRGAQFLGADIKSRDCAVAVVTEGKELVSGLGVQYTVVFRNDGPAVAAYNVQGGGLDHNAFNNMGDLVTIVPGETQLYHFYFGLGREDRGAQYASADVHTRDSELVAVDHAKERGVFGIDYYVTIRNDGQRVAAYNLQGGGLT